MTMLELFRRLDDATLLGFEDHNEVEQCVRNVRANLEGDAFSTLLDEAKLALNNYPNSREKSLVMTKLDEAALWMTKVGKP